MKTRNIIVILGMAAVLGACTQSRSVGTMPESRVAPSDHPTLSKGTTFKNGIIVDNGITVSNGVTLSNGVTIANGESRVFALANLASRPLAKKD